MSDVVIPGVHYTTTRENWELRPNREQAETDFHYTTTRENWELRPIRSTIRSGIDYTTTRENWELRLQVRVGV